MKKILIVLLITVTSCSLFARDKEEVVDKLFDGYWSYGNDGEKTMATFFPIEHDDKPCLLWNHLVRQSKENPVPYDYTRILFYHESDDVLLRYPYFATSGITETKTKFIPTPSGYTFFNFAGFFFSVKMEEITLWDFAVEENGNTIEEVRPFDESGYDLIVCLGNQVQAGDTSGIWHKTGCYFLKYLGKGVLVDGEFVERGSGDHVFLSDGFYYGDSFFMTVNEDRLFSDNNKAAQLHFICNFPEAYPFAVTPLVCSRYDVIPPSLYDMGNGEL